MESKANIIVIVGGERYAGRADIVSVYKGVASIAVAGQVPIHLAVEKFGGLEGLEVGERPNCQTAKQPNTTTVLALRPAGEHDRACWCKKCANDRGCDLRGTDALVVCNHFTDGKEDGK